MKNNPQAWLLSTYFLLTKLLVCTIWLVSQSWLDLKLYKRLLPPPQTLLLLFPVPLGLFSSINARHGSDPILVLSQNVATVLFIFCKHVIIFI